MQYTTKLAMSQSQKILSPVHKIVLRSTGILLGVCNTKKRCDLSISLYSTIIFMGPIRPY